MQGFDKTSEDRQWGTNFMGHIGHKIAPHGVCQHQRRHIAREHQFLALPVMMKVQTQMTSFPPGCSGGVKLDLLVVPLLRKEFGKSRRTYQMHDVLLQIARNLQAQVITRGLVHPFDLALLVEQDHAIRRGLYG